MEPVGVLMLSKATDPTTTTDITPSLSTHENESFLFVRPFNLGGRLGEGLGDLLDAQLGCMQLVRTEPE